jgi:hypothetical protein
LELQQKINALSDSDRQLLQTTAISVVNEMLPQIQEPIDSKDLESQIASKYNVSSDLASICVSLLLLYPEYKAKIKPTDQTQQPQQNQRSNLPSQKQPLLSQQRTASTNYKDMNWTQMRDIILKNRVI